MGDFIFAASSSFSLSLFFVLVGCFFSDHPGIKWLLVVVLWNSEFDVPYKKG